jgi:uncharacterized membrane protein YfcA
MKSALLASLAVITSAFIVLWTVAVLKAGWPPRPTLLGLLTGFGTNFLDTLGIGSFATTTSIFKLKKIVPDELIPGTLNVGHALPSIAEAFIFIAIVDVDAATLVLMIAASVLGAWLGAGIVSQWPRRKVQVGLGLALLCAASLMFMTQLQLFPAGGERLALTGMRLIIAILANCLLGALMTLGIGLYAPCMILVSLLGMNPKVAFPIMMGSCAFLMPAGSLRFIREGRYQLQAALALTLGGIPGVLLAAFLVRSLPLTAIRWLVIIVVVYTAVMLLRSAVVESRAMARSANAI